MYSPFLIKSSCFFLVVAAAPAAEIAQGNARVSLSTLGDQGNGKSDAAVISGDGRVVAFVSRATNLVPGDTNGTPDVFVRDVSGQTRCVSVSSAGAFADKECLNPSISADGRYVAFDSAASNLVPGDTNGRRDVFIHDLLNSTTVRVSLGIAGAEANGNSEAPSLSADGRTVAFTSAASNLVPGDTYGDDIFVRDLLTGQNTLVSISSQGVHANDVSYTPAISADGRTVAFVSQANNLVPGDTNGDNDIYVHDLQTGFTTRASLSSSGQQGSAHAFLPAISGDGRLVAFYSSASEFVAGDTNDHYDVFVHDRVLAITTRVSLSSHGAQGDASSNSPRFSSDGRFIAFDSSATNLVPGDSNGTHDAFIHDLATGQTSFASVTERRAPGNRSSTDPTLSANGRYVAFESDAVDLVPGDTNRERDIFVHDFGAAPVLTVAGNCPGPISLRVAGVPAGGRVAIAYGAAGTYPLSSYPCRWLVLALAHPSLGALATANGAGEVVLNFRAPMVICGLSLQALDADRCLLSNTVVL